MYHPNNQHHGGGTRPIQPVSAPLYVVTCISNPMRYRSRYDLYRRFEKYIENSGAILYTIEQGFGEREYEVTDPNNPRHIRVQSVSEVWHKENMLNLAIQRLPLDWKYVAWIDADIEFTRPDWVYETIHLLQQYNVIQMFSQAVDLDPQFKILNGMREGIIFSWKNDNYGHLVKHVSGYPPIYGAGNKHPGYAWAARRPAFNALGGLIDWAVVGSADWHMAAALVGQVEVSLSPALYKACPVYVQWCKDWQDRATKHLRHNIGCMDGLITHYWHGKKTDRRYPDRWKIMVENEFDPLLDLKKDWQGLWQLTDRNHRLRDDLRSYLSGRNEIQSTYNKKWAARPQRCTPKLGPCRARGGVRRSIRPTGARFPSKLIFSRGQGLFH